MSLQLLWYMLAAFIVGFALSTLWEWFYFRGRRLQWRDERLSQLTAELDSTRADLERYRAQASGVATAATYATAPVAPIDSEFQSSAARLESEQRDLAETAMRFSQRDTRQWNTGQWDSNQLDSDQLDSNQLDSDQHQTFDEPDQDQSAQDAPSPFDPEEQVHPDQRSIAPTAEAEDSVETDALRPMRIAQPVQTAEPPPRIITATPQAHAELSELIARLEELERRDAARTRPAGNTDYPVDIDKVAAHTGRSTVQAAVSEESTAAESVATEMPAPPAPIQPLPIEPLIIDTPPATATESEPVVAPAQQSIAATASRANDLQAISGIGQTYAKRLHDGGIHTWQHIAESDEETLRTLTKARAITDVAAWIAQAAALTRQHGQTSADDQPT
ncbi:MAG: hypothetical protein R3A44_27670 [Caldilineaceae bacterium]